MPGTGLEAQPSHILEPNLPRGLHPSGPAQCHPSCLGPFPGSQLLFLSSSDLANSILHQDGRNRCKRKAGLRTPPLKSLCACPGAQLESDSSLPPTQALQDMDPLINPTGSPPAPLSRGTSSFQPRSLCTCCLLQVSTGTGSGLWLSGPYQRAPHPIAPKHMLSLIPSWQVTVGKQLVYLVTCLFSVSPAKT